MLKKGFFIDLEDSFTYPTVTVICSCIENYAKSTGEKLEFVSKQKPVTFRLDDVPYVAKITLMRGWYFIHCKEY
jgi:hypothetical protein